MAWAAWGNSMPAGMVTTFRVRISRRPCAVSALRWQVWTWRQGSSASWRRSRGWLALTVSTQWAPRPCRSSTCSRCVCSASTVITTPVRSMPVRVSSSGANAVISLVLPATFTCPSTIRAWWSITASRCRPATVTPPESVCREPSGSPGSLPSRGSLRTGRAAFTASGSSKSLWASEGVGRWCCRCVRWQSASSALPPVGGQSRVVRGRVGLDHLVAADGSPGQACQAGAGVPVTKEPSVLSGRVEPPEVAVHDPSVRLRLVPVLGPREHRPHQGVVDLGEHLLGHDRPVVRRPAAQDRVEPADHGKRIRAVEAAHLGAQPGPEPLDGRLGRLDQQLSGAAVVAGVKPEEVKPFGQVHDAGLVLVERQPSGCQPRGEPLLDLLGLLPGVAKRHQGPCPLILDTRWVSTQRLAA